MYSNFNPWEFKQNYPHLLTEGNYGLYALSCYDPYIEKLFLNLVPHHFIDGGWKVISGPEVTVAWLEDHLSTLDFFSANQSFKVLMCEQMPQKAKDFLLNEKIEWGNRYFLLSFLKEDKFFDKCKKRKDFYSLKINEPKFWEQGKLIKFLCETTGIYLPLNVQNTILELVPNEPGELILAMKKLALLTGNPQKVTVTQAKEVLGLNRIDQFEMARVWGERRFSDFYKDLLQLSGDFDGLIVFFRFMQGHIIKMIDPSYMREKNKLSKYDKQIESQGRLWSRAELTDELRFFSECEILAKGKSKDLTNQLRLKVLASF